MRDLTVAGRTLFCIFSICCFLKKVKKILAGVLNGWYAANSPSQCGAHRLNYSAPFVQSRLLCLSHLSRPSAGVVNVWYAANSPSQCGAHRLNCSAPLLRKWKDLPLLSEEGLSLTRRMSAVFSFKITGVFGLWRKSRKNLIFCVVCVIFFLQKREYRKWWRSVPLGFFIPRGRRTSLPPPSRKGAIWCIYPFQTYFNSVWLSSVSSACVNRRKRNNRRPSQSSAIISLT